MYTNIYSFINNNFLPVMLILMAVFISYLLMIINMKNQEFLKKISWVFLIGYLAILFYITLGSRTRQDAPMLDMKVHLFRWDLVQGRSVEWLRQGDLGNIILFFPLGMILQELISRKHRFICCISIGAILSISIEILQYFFQIGYCDINDFICNLVGTVLGYMVLAGVCRLHDSSN